MLCKMILLMMLITGKFSFYICATLEGGQVPTTINRSLAALKNAEENWNLVTDLSNLVTATTLANKAAPFYFTTTLQINRTIRTLPSSMGNQTWLGISFLLYASNGARALEQTQKSSASKNKLGNIYKNFYPPHDDAQFWAVIFQPEVVMKVGGVGSTFSCSNRKLEVLSILEETVQIKSLIENGVSVGLEYSEKLIDCCEHRDFVPLRKVNVSVVNVQFSGNDTLFSYSLFLARMRAVNVKNRDFVRRHNPRCIIYIHIQLQKCFPENEENEHVDNAYRTYLIKYARAWVDLDKENDIRVIVEGSPLDLNFYPLTWKLGGEIYPILDDREYHSRIRKKNYLDTSCKIQVAMNTAGCVFRNFVLPMDSSDISKLVMFTSNCDKFAASSCPDRRPQRFHLLTYNAQQETMISLLTKMSEMRQFPNVKTLYLHEPKRPRMGSLFMPSPVSDLFSYVAQKAKKLGINVGCRVLVGDVGARRQSDISAIQNLVESRCGKLLDIDGIIVLLEWSISVHEPADLLTALNVAVEIRRRMHEPTYGKIFEVGLRFLDQPESKTDKISVVPDEPRVSMYCADVLKLTNTLMEALVTWATVQQFNLILQPVFDTKLFGGWWMNLITDKEINRTVTDFPVLVRRNVPISLNEEMSTLFPNTYPCIDWTQAPLDKGIEFHSHAFSGAYINMKWLLHTRKTALRASDWETLLSFAFGRFTSIEITNFKGGGNDSINNRAQIFQPLSPKFLKMLEEHDVDGNSLNKSLYFEVDSIIDLRYVFSTYNSSIPSGIHLSGWEKATFMEQSEIGSIIFSSRENTNSSLKFGLTVQNCAEELNHHLARLENLSFFSLVDYVVCNQKPIYPTNSDKNAMQTYLDTHLYIREFFRNFVGFQNMTVRFRLNFYSEDTCVGGRETTESFLRFLADVNQYSATYQIEYFMVEAFSADPCYLSWWRVGSTGSLSDLSLYKERESEYFGRPTVPRFQINPIIKEKVQVDAVVPILSIALGTSVVVLLLFSAMLTVRLTRSRRTIRRLTAREERAFRNGDSSSSSPLCDYIDAEALNGLKYVEDFELPKENIKLGKMIGRGHFGKVFRAVLNEFLDVAVKVPSSECSKDAFKNMLAEVKVLCYLGNHENVLSLIGAYTKDIVMGEIYIITQFCSNGNLLDYLRNLDKSNLHLDIGAFVGGESLASQTFEFYRLCFQIASGMKYIAEKKVVHGDLSARNILLDSSFVCKIGDFGLSKMLYNYDEYVAKTSGPLPWRWMAPECMRSKRFTTKSDVWSFGVTVWEIFSFGNIPYHTEELSEEFVERLESGMRLAKPSLLTDQIYREIQKCWRISMAERLEFVELVDYFSRLMNTDYVNTI